MPSLPGRHQKTCFLVATRALTLGDFSVCWTLLVRVPVMQKHVNMGSPSVHKDMVDKDLTVCF